jgi:choline transport protein
MAKPGMVSTLDAERDSPDPTQPSKRNRGTADDDHMMRMLGKKQVLNRNFRFISTLGFACTLMSTWEIELASSVFGLLNGGTAGLIWGYLVCWVGYCLVFASIAEMASISPTSGGQYHWVSEFAPKSCQRFLSWLVGWISVLGWQIGLASLTFIVGTVIQGLIVLNNASYVFERWQGTLLVIAIVAFCILFNSYFASKLPMIEGLVLIIHILGFFAVLISLWVLSPRSAASDVFGTLTNLGGWSSNGLSFMVGLLTPVYTLLGADSAVHMSEEIKDASLTLPRAIMTSAFFNGTLGWVMTITFCFCLGDLLSIIETPTGYPFIQVFYNSTKSHAGASILTSLIIINITSACISTVATVSRQTWAFARDNGLPFSSIITHVKPGWNVPLNAVLITFTITCLLSLINIGSTVAFNAIGSAALVSILSTYFISITVLIYRRFQGPLPPHRWDLGRFGLPINIGAVAWLMTVWVFCFFPIAVVPPVTLQTMNWNCVIYGGIIIIGLAYWLVWGRKIYTPPVFSVKRE